MKSIIRNKRGEGDLLSEETIKLIISIMSISILLLLAGSLFYMFIKGSKFRQAEATLEEIILTVEGLDEGEIGRVLVTGPMDWYILKFGNKLCICEINTEDSCDGANTGVCREVKDISVSPTYEKFKYTNGIIIGDIMEVLVFDYKEERIILKGDYNDFVFARGFLDKEYSFFGGNRGRMEDYILNYIKSRELGSAFDYSDVNEVSWKDNRFKITDVDGQREALMKGFFNRYFSESDIKSMVVFLYIEGVNSDLIVSDVNSMKDSLVFKIGEISRGNVYVRFSK